MLTSSWSSSSAKAALSVLSVNQKINKSFHCIPQKQAINILLIFPLTKNTITIINFARFVPKNPHLAEVNWQKPKKLQRSQFFGIPKTKKTTTMTQQKKKVAPDGGWGWVACFGVSLVNVSTQLSLRIEWYTIKYRVLTTIYKVRLLNFYLN
mgnify:CR=1 FL=1